MKILLIKQNLNQIPFCKVTINFNAQLHNSNIFSSLTLSKASLLSKPNLVNFYVPEESFTVFVTNNGMQFSVAVVQEQCFRSVSI